MWVHGTSSATNQACVVAVPEGDIRLNVGPTVVKCSDYDISFPAWVVWICLLHVSDHVFMFWEMEFNASYVASMFGPNVVLFGKFQIFEL